MKLFLIRHGETVDNIAGNLAGVTDSQLTNYGVDQTKCLGKYFASTNIIFSHIFASPLSRAARTAQAIVDAQPKAPKDDEVSLAVVLVSDLIEQDFGSYEGKPFGSRSSPSKSGRKIGPGDPGFVDVETKEAMGKRSDRFIDEHLMPVVEASPHAIIAIVAHGMLLSTLWRRVLLRIPRKSLSIAPEVTAARGSLILEHLGGWSNTGYLELHLSKTEGTTSESAATGGSLGRTDDDTAQPGDREADPPVTATRPVSPPPMKVEPSEPLKRTTFSGYTVTIVAIDSRTHLIGLKRQRGGIGRLAHDESQSKLTSFFKKPRTS